MRFNLSKEVRKGNMKKVENSREALSVSENADIRNTSKTKLLIEIVQSHKSKLKINKVLRIILFSFSLLVLLGLLIAFILCLLFAIYLQGDVSTILAILIPAGVTVTVNIIAIILTITKYLFPQTEDQNTAELIQVLTSEDLHKKDES